MTECAEMDEMIKKMNTNKGGESVKNHCKYSIYDYGGAKNHKTNRSQHCSFYGLDHKIIGM